MKLRRRSPGPVASTLGDVAAAVGRGIFAGLAGTAAMTAGQAVEMKLRGRPGSTTPGDLAAGLLGVEAVGEAERQRFSNLVHWTWGTGWGVLRGLLATSGLRGVPVLVTHFAIVLGGDFALLACRGLAPPPWRWTRQELVFEALHKGVLTTTTHLAYQLLDR
jgi:hypothetical protein